MNLTKNKYYFEALDCFPYNLPECLEALNYALSYDPEDADALCLMARIHSEILKDYETAKKYFAEAMMHDVANINTPEFYINCLINNEDFEEAEKLINYSSKIKGIDQSVIWILRSYLSEKRGNFINAIHFLEKAKKYCFNSCSLEHIKERKKFVKSKIIKKKSKKKTKETD
ncbi:tetratricopeptide repeat protein [Frigoriflavimonas asaccharolytica]|uniref:Tetratricopeptide (TPR) repeat protein n=1 Tax=Frigoriflavimonas asaccharolytica TaxID=2735899 RepID=A0A8J8GB73_9FLAO|nr:tetratricopeptide repeat protein [Frigoriflavimonas asaccharolytica]NRS92467.1 tetratricopeptide (TPR) repeat protein [Frigoriflavimonas asaccharolytica]